jgi:hypothetical protein
VKIGEKFEAPLEQLVCAERSCISFREWIEVVEPKNKDRLFKLLDTTEREDCESEVGDSVTKVQEGPHTNSNLSSSHHTATDMSIVPPLAQGINLSIIFNILLPGKYQYPFTGTHSKVLTLEVASVVLLGIYLVAARRFGESETRCPEH